MFGKKKDPNGNSSLQGLYSAFGFSEGYNFFLWFTFAGALLGFTLARLMYLNINGVFCGPGSGLSRAAPGECYHYQNFDRYAIGIRLHLFTILPACLLVVLQFTPKIRHKALLFHRIAGYITIPLALVANAGALMIARKAFGGTVATQALVGTLAIGTTAGLALAYYNIKRLQIDQHRAWMLRTWFYFTSIITLRIIMIAAANILSSSSEDAYYSIQPCAKLLSVLSSSSSSSSSSAEEPTNLTTLYPTCTTPSAVAPVRVNMSGSALEAMAALDESFGMSGWVALVVHAVGVEVYLHLTPGEARRLRRVSCERQVKAGFGRAGRVGLVAGHEDVYEGTLEGAGGEGQVQVGMGRKDSVVQEGA